MSELAYSEAIRRVTPASHVVLTGPLSRTWYSDRNVVINVMEWLTSCAVAPIAIGNSGFLACASEGAGQVPGAVLGVLDELDGSVMAILRRADLIVILVDRINQSIDDSGEVAKIVQQEGFPFLALYLDGHAFLG